MQFLILGDTRCGTGLVKNFLSLQKNIFCHDEIFKIRFLDKLITRENTPVKIIERLKCEKQFVGVKITFLQAYRLYEKYNFDIKEYIKEKKLNIIFMERKNKFLKNLSKQKAQITGCYQIEKQDRNLLEKTNIKFNFDIKQYFKDTGNRNCLHYEYSTFLNQNNINFFEVYYEDLIGSESETIFKNIVKFIEGTDENYIAAEVPIIKQNIYTVEQQLLNFKDVKSALKDDYWFQTTINQENYIK
jgi:LPS sulfotransferase NodH